MKDASIMKLSSHAVEGERLYRVNAIKTLLGLGYIKYAFDEVNESKRTCRKLCYTTTGVMLVCDKLINTIITMYVPTFAQVYALFEGEMPDEVRNMAHKNDIMFHKEARKNSSVAKRNFLFKTLDN